MSSGQRAKTWKRKVGDMSLESILEQTGAKEGLSGHQGSEPQ